MCPSQNGSPLYDELGLRILLVEDSPTQRIAATSVLKRQGVDVTCASDGKEAVAAVARQDFDAVFMDVEMPIMDGLAATAEIRQLETPLNKHTPIIALTSTTDREKCLAAGMDGFAAKPLNSERLQQLVGIVTQVRSSQEPQLL
jgi:CheY-like chemotaxis protein